MHTIQDVAARYVVNEHTVLSWIRSGELTAINVNRASSRPRWRISSDAIDVFEACRSSHPCAHTPRTKKKSRVAAEFIK